MTDSKKIIGKLYKDYWLCLGIKDPHDNTIKDNHYYNFGNLRLNSSSTICPDCYNTTRENFEKFKEVIRGGN